MSRQFTLQSTPKIDFSKPVDTSAVKGQSVLITGGAGGLGWAMASALAHAGAKVTIADLNAETGEAAVKSLTDKGLEAMFVQTDAASWDSQLAAFKKTIAHYGALDTVIPNAGIAGLRLDALAMPKDLPPDADPPEPSITAMKINMIGVYYSTILALHYFAKLSAKEGTPQTSKRHLLFVGSLAGYLDQPLVSEYAITKWGVRGLYRSVRLSGHVFGGVRSNLIAPTYIETGLTKGRVDLLRSVGIHVGTPEDVAAACMTLCCDESIDNRTIIAVSGADVGNGTPGSANVDIGDDYEGRDAGPQLYDLITAGAFGSETGINKFLQLRTQAAPNP